MNVSFTLRKIRILRNLFIENPEGFQDNPEEFQDNPEGFQDNPEGFQDNQVIQW